MIEEKHHQSNRSTYWNMSIIAFIGIHFFTQFFHEIPLPSPPAEEAFVSMMNPSISAALSGGNYDEDASCTEAGHVELDLLLHIKNTGDTHLDQLMAGFNLSNLLGTSFIEVVSSPILIQSSFGSVPAFDPDFSGSGMDTSIFVLSDSIIGVNDSLSVAIRILIDPNAGGISTVSNTQFEVSGRVLDGTSTPLVDPIAGGDWIVADVSDAGLLAGEPNLGFVGDTGGEDDALPLNLPNIGLSKRIVNYAPAISNIPGNVDVFFRLTLENIGNTPLTNIELTDDVGLMGNAFVRTSQQPVISSSNANANPLTSSFPYILDGTGGILLPAERMVIDYKIEIDPDASGVVLPIENAAYISANGIGLDGNSLTVSDISDAGANPEDINMGHPGDTGCENDSLVIYLPTIAAAQHVVGVLAATSGANGHFDAIFQIVLQNAGNVSVTNLELVQNLTTSAQLGTAFVAVTDTVRVLSTGVNGTDNTATSNPLPNLNYDGSNDLLNGGGELLPGEITIVQYQVEINGEAANAPSVLKVHAWASAKGIGVDGLLVDVTDLSDSGFLPQSNNPNRPGDTGGSNDPTILTNCHDKVSGGIACNDNVQVSLNDECLVLLTPPMILEGEFEQCANDSLLPMGTYYEILMVQNLGGFPVPDADSSTLHVHEIDGSYMNQQLAVKVREKVNSNSCWGYIMIKDKMGPYFDCPTTPILFGCADEIPADTAPDLIDNCDPDPEVSYVGEQIIDNDICDGTYIIRRNYTGNDASGNEVNTPCTVEIQLNRMDIEFPKDVRWSCEQYNAVPAIIEAYALHPSILDSDPSDPADIDVNPNLGNLILNNTGSGIVANTTGRCAYNVVASDQLVDGCGASFEIVRTWTVIDWCTGQILTSDSQGNDNVQVVKVEDRTAPEVTRFPFQVSADETSNNPVTLCYSRGFLQPPSSVSDNCGSDVTIQIITPVGAADYVGTDGSEGGFIPNPGLPIGVHDIEYRVSDECGNTHSIFVPITVADLTTPTAICDEITDVSLGSMGEAEVFAETFDDGSKDNCCVDRFEVRRMDDPCSDNHDDTAFGPSIIFCCNDIGAGPQMVVFRIYDCNNNFNECMVEVHVNDKAEPTLLNCPADQRMLSDDYKADYELDIAALGGNQPAQSELFDADFGTPTFRDNCSFEINKTIAIDLDQCLEGRVIRRWRAEDPSGQLSQQCIQRIFVDHVSDWVVEFPEDLHVTCGSTLPDFGEPTIFYENCEMIAVSHDDDTLNMVANGCFKIVREWVVINWCVVGDEIDQEVEESTEEELGLPLSNCDLDGDGDCDDRTYRDSWNLAGRPDFTIANQSTNPDTDTDSDPWDGYISHQQIMYVSDNVDPVFAGGCDIPDAVIQAAGCTGTIMLPTLSGSIMDCSPMTSVTVSSDIPNGFGFGPYSDVPPGIYNITYMASDNCSNETMCSTTIEVEDGKKPTVYCKPEVIIVMQDGPPPAGLLNAGFVDDGSTDDCGDITFSFSSDTTFTDTIFLCHQLPFVDSVEMWVTDQAGNQDFCKSKITLQDPNNVCDDDTLVVQIGGYIDTENGSAVEGVEINLTGQTSVQSNTDGDGQFQLYNLPIGNDISIAPLKDDDPSNGVTTYDLVLISKHILGVKPLDSPYKLIAADANRSGTVTTFDLVEIRKLILHINDDFPANTSWRFVSKSHQFDEPTNPWSDPFPEIISVNNLSDDLLEADFIGVKTGDVNGSVQSNLNEEIDDRGATGALILQTENQFLEEDELVTIALKTDNFDALGFQFTLQFDPSLVEFVDAQPCLTDAGHIGKRYIEDGFLTVSWNDHQSTWLPGEPLLQVVFKTLKTSELKDAVQLTSRYTPAEAYNLEGELMDVQLAIDGSFVSDFELLQNVPNPFSEKTTIGFRLGEAAPAVLTITDVSGRVVKTIENEYPSGYNEIEINRSELPSSGILYYRMDTPGHSDTKMMLLVN